MIDKKRVILPPNLKAKTKDDITETKWNTLLAFLKESFDYVLNLDIVPDKEDEVISLKPEVKEVEPETEKLQDSLFEEVLMTIQPDKGHASRIIPDNLGQGVGVFKSEWQFIEPLKHIPEDYGFYFEATNTIGGILEGTRVIPSSYIDLSINKEGMSVSFDRAKPPQYTDGETIHTFTSAGWELVLYYKTTMVVEIGDDNEGDS